MLKLIEGSFASFFPRETDAMFRNRAETFRDRLGWDVVVENGYERDRFDDLNPLYLVSVDPVTERYWGSLRMLPTTGPNMLRDVFPQLLEEGEIIESETIWEASRFCARLDKGQPGRGADRIGYVMRELIIGAGEVAQMAGLTQIVSVFDARIKQLFERAEIPVEIIGRPQRFGDVMAYAGMFDPEPYPDALAKYREKHGMGETVLAPGAKELVFAA
jgi:N-acyl-L-homoserine lactone synthetase